jgi:tRNA-dihydrouridine synthase
MASIDRAGELMDRIRKSTKKRLSVKLRIGFTDDFDYLLRFCRRLAEAGTERITLHPRTASEKFKRRARWDYVDRLREELDIPVIGNGDINDAAELVEKARGTSGSAGVMAGRGAVRHPWIFAQAKMVPFLTPPIEETGLRFLDLLARYQPPEFHLSRARRFFSYFCDNLKWGNYVKNLLNREEDLAGIERVWVEYFESGNSL